jgi:Rps23 Pro-64 3,4-dihydroxylase Tpa1-like proline 4-hydroxylase
MSSSDKPINIEETVFSAVPFPYFVCPQAINTNLSYELLDWLEKAAPWKLVETDFYEQYEFSFLQTKLPDSISILNSKDHLQDLTQQVAQNFSVRLANRIDFTAHKLIPGQRIRIHNDYIPGFETHRLLIQLNRGWEDENGGMLMLFNSQNPEDIYEIYRPIHGSALGFAISPDSHHAVSTIHGGERYTLVYSFYQIDDDQSSK